MRLSAHFCARLAAIRLDRGLTLAELAALIGRTKTTICRWEHGAPAEIHRSDVAKCARVLRCSRKVLLAPLDEPIPPAPIARERLICEGASLRLQPSEHWSDVADLDSGQEWRSVDLGARSSWLDCPKYVRSPICGRGGANQLKTASSFPTS